MDIDGLIGKTKGEEYIRISELIDIIIKLDERLREVEEYIESKKDQLL